MIAKNTELTESKQLENVVQRVHAKAEQWSTQLDLMDISMAWYLITSLTMCSCNTEAVLRPKGQFMCILLHKAAIIITNVTQGPLV